MGLLDDAIREHLELKLRHGAAAEEVARQEAEALGPPQRREFAAPPGEAGASFGAFADEPLAPAEPTTATAQDAEVPTAPPAYAEPTVVADPYDEPTTAADPVYGERTVAADPYTADAATGLPPTGVAPTDLPPADLPVSGPRGARPLGEPAPPAEDAWLPDEGFAAPPAPVPFDDPAPSAAGSRRLDPDAPRAVPRDDDVLEETPDFLSETPDHDRLWFEQKPPRDFDFDK